MLVPHTLIVCRRYKTNSCAQPQAHLGILEIFTPRSIVISYTFQDNLREIFLNCHMALKPWSCFMLGDGMLSHRSMLPQPHPKPKLSILQVPLWRTYSSVFQTLRLALFENHTINQFTVMVSVYNNSLFTYPLQKQKCTEAYLFILFKLYFSKISYNIQQKYFNNFVFFYKETNHLPLTNFQTISLVTRTLKWFTCANLPYQIMKSIHGL